MPWQGDGTFLRVNPDYSASVSGELWGKDLAAQPSIKIIASRHDFHDQDLADGIEASLNIDGLNAMRANLNMGSYKITNIGAAANNAEIPTYGQTAGALDYDDGTKILTLNDRDGNPIDTTSIDLTGIGAGVTQINSDGTLEVSPSPITGVGTVGLKVLAAGQSFTGGISGIIIDDYGRVTQVTVGSSTSGDPDQSILIGQSFTNAVQITITKQSGNQTKTIQAASSNLAGVMTNLQWRQLDELPDSDRVMDLDSNQTIVGSKRFTGGGDTVLGNDGLPGVFFKGILVQADGDVFMNNLPTADPGVQGQIYADNGILKISP